MANPSDTPPPSDETSDDAFEEGADMTSLRMAALRNPNVQPARRRRSLRSVFEAAEREAALRKEGVAEPQPEKEEPLAPEAPQADAKEASTQEPKPDAPIEEKKTEAKKKSKKTASSVPKRTPEPPVKMAPKPTPQPAPTLKPKPAPLGDLVLSLRQVSKTYGQGAQAIEVLRGVDFDIHAGQILGLIGPSGSGKSTLLQIAGLLDNPTTGEVQFGDRGTQSLGDRARTLLRRDTVGFVYQFHHLLKEFSALENVMMPQRIAGIQHAKAKARAQDLLTRVGLSHRLNHRPAALSGGEQQRVAIARALANRPKLLLADEPTGNLDPETAEGVFQMLLELTREEGMAALIATHNLDLGARMDAQVRLEKGALVHV